MPNSKILFISPQPLWPTNTGARLRNFHLAKSLCRHFQVTVLQAISPDETLASETNTDFKSVLSATRNKSYTPINLIKGLLGPLPFTVLTYYAKSFQRVLIDTLNSQKFDFVQIESIHMAPYLSAIRGATATNIPVVLDWHNIESELMFRFAKGSSSPAKRIVGSRVAQLLHRLEQNALGTFSAHTVVSKLEQEKLLKRAPQAKVHIIPNGVDTSAFSVAPEQLVGTSGKRVLLFVGSMDYHANSEAVIWFTNEIWPQLSAEFADLDFKIVGRNPPPAVQSLASSRIIVTGTVKDVRPYYQEALAILVPLRVGGGTRLKILEAMAARVPVISTHLGAEGIEVEDEKNILLADTSADMARAIRRLLGEPQFAESLIASAHGLAVNRYDWQVIGSALANVYTSLKD